MLQNKHKTLQNGIYMAYMADMSFSHLKLFELLKSS